MVGPSAEPLTDDDGEQELPVRSMVLTSLCLLGLQVSAWHMFTEIKKKGCATVVLVEILILIMGRNKSLSIYINKVL